LNQKIKNISILRNEKFRERKDPGSNENEKNVSPFEGKTPEWKIILFDVTKTKQLQTLL